MKATPSVSICEVFETLQGEGKSMGKPVTFVRFAGCNLECGSAPGAKWKCDTEKIWRVGKAITIPDLGEQILRISPSHIVFTGGEPLLWLDGILQLLDYMCKDQYVYFDSIEIETNGTLPLSVESAMKIREHCDVLQINCSPKLSNSGMYVDERLVVPVLSNLVKLDSLKLIDLQFKFVVADEADIEEVEGWFDFDSDTKIEGFDCVSLTSDKVVFMPAAETRDALVAAMQVLWPLLVNKGYHMTTRMHIIAFDKKAGI